MLKSWAKNIRSATFSSAAATSNRFEICEDAWVAARPGAKLAPRVWIDSQSQRDHFAFGKIQVGTLCSRRSPRFNVTYLYSNLLGNESGRAIYDGGTLIASGDRLLAKGPRFSYQDVV